MTATGTCTGQKAVTNDEFSTLLEYVINAYASALDSRAAYKSGYTVFALMVNTAGQDQTKERVCIAIHRAPNKYVHAVRLTGLDFHLVANGVDALKMYFFCKTTYTAQQKQFPNNMIIPTVVFPPLLEEVQVVVLCE